VLIKEGEIQLQERQLAALHVTCRLLEEGNKVMCEVINKCAVDQMGHQDEAGYELKREDMERANECQNRILEATALGFRDPMQDFLRLAHADVHALRGVVKTLKEQLQAAHLALQVSSEAHACRQMPTPEHVGRCLKHVVRYGRVAHLASVDMFCHAL